MRSRTTNGLIVVQIALGFVLVCAAVMFGRLPSLITGMNPGFDMRHTIGVTVKVDTSAANHANALTFNHTLESRILAIPGVQSLTYASLGPFGPVPPTEIRLPDQTAGQGKPASVDDVSSSFFSTLDIPLIKGRSFNSADPTSPSANSVAIVSQAFAREFWQAEDPSGSRSSPLTTAVSPSLALQRTHNLKASASPTVHASIHSAIRPNWMAGSTFVSPAIQSPLKAR